MIDRSLLKNTDWILIALLLLNSGIGVAFIHSSSHYLPTNYALKQTFWILAGLVTLMIFLSINYQTLVTYAFVLYGMFLFVLAGILLFGRMTAGTKSWIVLPFFHIQPSELGKIVLVLVLAKVFAEHKADALSFGHGVLGGLIVGAPMMLVAFQPDLGTALTYLPILLAAFFLAGLRRKSLILLLLVALLVGILGWNVFLKDYQKQRIMTLVSPGKDPRGAGYHMLQSKIAIGSGGLLGKGYKKGTQSQLRFLPARHTDFIFSVIGEEFGFFGVMAALFLYFLLLARLFQSVAKARDRAGVYIVFMVSVMIAFQFLANVLMTIGLFPIAGIPLPLLSYGGSSLLTHYLAVGLVLNVKMRRFVYV
ncbi:MAG: rod shape-determining protein RodA [Candidatus Aminicenantales bacterium]